MKKIQDDILQQMLKDGKQQRDIADHFHVSESAISQRVKRLQQAEPPESFQKLTPKAQKYVLAKLEGKSSTAAALDSHDCGNLASAKSLGGQLARDPDVSLAMSDVLHQEGIGRRPRVRRLRDVINSNDLGIVTRGLTLAAQMSGDMQPERVEISVDFPELQRQMFEAADRLRDHYLKAGNGDIYITPDRLPEFKEP
ncbi:MAG: hypothetical protein ACOYOS_07975 [Syntrophales bacterium]